MVDNPLANGKCRPTSRHTTIRCSYIKCMMRRSYCACKRSVHSRRTRHYNQLTIGSKIDSNQLGKLEKNGSERLYAVINYTYIRRNLWFHSRCTFHSSRCIQCCCLDISQKRSSCAITRGKYYQNFKRFLMPPKPHNKLLL